MKIDWTLVLGIVGAVVMFVIVPILALVLIR